jgi:hypothetical protein
MWVLLLRFECIYYTELSQWFSFCLLSCIFTGLHIKIPVVYVVGLQAAVFLIAKFHSLNTDSSKCSDESAVSLIMADVLLAFGNDGGWIFDAIITSLEKHHEVCNDRRMIRIPPTLMDGLFISKLRNGEALWLLQRLSFLTRLSKIMNAALDSVILRKSIRKYLCFFLRRC